MTSSWIALQAVALLVCLFLVSFSQSADAARWVDIDHQNEDIPSFRSLLHKKKSEKEMIKYCSKPKNRKKKVCITWALGHKQFNSTAAAKSLGKLLNAKSCPKKGRAGSVFTPFDATIGRRIALISSALRCKWETIAPWTCSTCSSIPNFTVLSAYQVSTTDPDGFIVSFDQQLNAVVLTFRSTYCASSVNCFSLQWFSNFQGLATTTTLPTGSYRVHAGIQNTWSNDLKVPVLQALQAAFALHPSASHNGLYVTGHSRGGALATVAAVELSFEAANLGLTAPREQVKLYTMGAFRVAESSYASLVENLFTTRYRIVNNIDLVTLVPPEKVQWIEDLLYLLGDVGKELIRLGNAFNFYKHFGPVVLNIDTSSLKAVKICPDGECTDCFAAALATLALGRDWDDSVFTRVIWDHQWYMGTDMDNANCKMNGRRSYNPVIYD